MLSYTSSLLLYKYVTIILHIEISMGEKYFIYMSVKNTEFSSFRMERGEEPLSVLFMYRVKLLYFLLMIEGH